MKLKLFTLLFLLSFSIGQDRSTVFSTGSEDPDPSLGGYPIQHLDEGGDRKLS